MKMKTLTTYEYLLRLPPSDQTQPTSTAAPEGNFSRCRQCAKVFAERRFLEKHYAKSHPTIDFTKDCPSDGSISKVLRRQAPA